MESYRAPWWLPGPHLQTVAAALLAGRLRTTYDREIWTTPDGDFIDVDWAGPEDAPRLLVLFHGLGGSSRSHYARAIIAHAVARGEWRCAVPHFRGCSGEPNLRPRAYHAGDSNEIDWILRRLAGRHVSMHAVGVSLGGNALLKWLGEHGESARDVVCRAVAVSAPFDLTAFGERMGQGLNLLYGWYFLYVAGLRRMALRKVERFRAELVALGITERRVRNAITLPRFDDNVTAPMHGFIGKHDYWKRASAKPLLSEIRAPTLLLNARNDPFLPERALPENGAAIGNLTVDIQAEGGHAGFAACDEWLARRVIEFLSVT